MSGIPTLTPGVLSPERSYCFDIFSFDARRISRDEVEGFDNLQQYSVNRVNRNYDGGFGDSQQPFAELSATLNGDLSENPGLRNYLNTDFESDSNNSSFVFDHGHYDPSGISSVFCQKPLFPEEGHTAAGWPNWGAGMLCSGDNLLSMEPMQQRQPDMMFRHIHTEMSYPPQPTISCYQMKRGQHVEAAPFVTEGLTNLPQSSARLSKLGEESIGLTSHLLAAVSTTFEPNPNEFEPTASSNQQYPCPACTKFKGEMRILREHMRCHIRPFGCPKASCGQSFSTKRDLERHDKSVHQKTTKKCPICFVSIKGGRVDNLRRHIRPQHSAKD